VGPSTSKEVDARDPLKVNAVVVAQRQQKTIN